MKSDGKIYVVKSSRDFGISDFQIYDLLDFAKYGIEEVGGKQKMKAGKNLTVIHGHEMFNSTAPVNFARTLQTNLGVCAILVIDIKHHNMHLKLQTINIYTVGPFIVYVIWLQSMLLLIDGIWICYIRITW